MGRTVAVEFQGDIFQVHQKYDQSDWFMTLQDVARAFGVTDQNIQYHLKEHASEFRSGIELGDDVRIPDSIGRTQTNATIYKIGVVKLGFFIRNPRAAAFREYAAMLVMKDLDNAKIGAKQFDDFLDAREDLEQILQFAQNLPARKGK